MMRPITLFIALFDCVVGVAQTPLTVQEYDAHKSAGTLPADAVLLMDHLVKPVHPAAAKGGGGPCGCWIEPDGSYTLAMTPNDDGSSAAITLPFIFSLFGDSYSTVYINNNGNISFDAPYLTYSADSFPSPNFVMVAPFWADVDTRDTLGGSNGEVWYKVTPTALYVNWVDVGYYAHQSDKLNSFQLIVTDGTDPVIPGGNNVSFCYRDMNWTTGEASCSPGDSCVNALGLHSCSNLMGAGYGYCGIPATVGVNRGNAVDHSQIGRFNMPDTNYYGPYGAVSEVDWLDSTHFYLNTASALGVPPIFASTFGCDTIIVMVGATLAYHMLVIAGGPGEAVSTLSSCPTLAGYTQLSSTTGPVSVTTSSVSPVIGDIGVHTVHYDASNDDLTPLVSGFDLIIKVVPNTLGFNDPTTDHGIVLQPNPATQNVVILLPGMTTEAAMAELLTAEGRVIAHAQISPSTDRVEFDLSAVAPGAYLVRVQGPSGTSTSPLIRLASR